ncbi:MAG: helix-turn-helix transcriptional regulator [Bacteroidota bacterium]
MTAIPEITFREPPSSLPYVEVLTLREFYHRLPSVQHHDPFSPHRVSFFLILAITSGRGQHYIDFQPHAYQPGSLLFIAKHQVQAFERKPDSQGHIILFTEAFLANHTVISKHLPDLGLYNYHLGSPVIYVEDEATRHLLGLTTQIYDEYQGTDDFAKSEILRTLLHLLLLRAERVKHRSAVQQARPEWLSLFNQFRTLLEHNYANTRNARDYAQQIGISYKHLNDVCKAVVAKTAKQFIDHVVATEVKRYLASTTLSVKELSYAVGFDEPTNLVQFFKRQTRQTPGQFRRGLKEVPGL